MPPLAPIQFATKCRHAGLKGAYFTFEASISKVEGNEGFADVWYKGHFALDHIGNHANLEKAYLQAPAAP